MSYLHHIGIVLDPAHVPILIVTAPSPCPRCLLGPGWEDDLDNLHVHSKRTGEVAGSVRMVAPPRVSG